MKKLNLNFIIAISFSSMLAFTTLTALTSNTPLKARMGLTPPDADGNQHPFIVIGEDYPCNNRYAISVEDGREAAQMTGAFWIDLSIAGSSKMGKTLNKTQSLDKISKIDIAPITKSTVSETKLGVDAQNLAAVFPESVRTFKNHHGQSYTAKDYNDLFFTAIGAIQSLNVKNRKQEEKLNAMETTINELRKEMKQLRQEQAETTNIPSQPQPSALKSLDTNTSSIHLQQNFPNPIREQTSIYYQLPPNTKTAQLLITNVQGKTLQTIPLEIVEQGNIVLNKQQFSTQSGNYFYTLVADGQTLGTKKMTFLGW